MRDVPDGVRRDPEHAVVKDQRPLCGGVGVDLEANAAGRRVLDAVSFVSARIPPEKDVQRAEIDPLRGEHRERDVKKPPEILHRIGQLRQPHVVILMRVRDERAAKVPERNVEIREQGVDRRPDVHKIPRVPRRHQRRRAKRPLFGDPVARPEKRDLHPLPSPAIFRDQIVKQRKPGAKASVPQGQSAGSTLGSVYHVFRCPFSLVCRPDTIDAYCVEI